MLLSIEYAYAYESNDERLFVTSEIQCKACPVGGVCVDRTKGCGLRATPFACPLVGQWERDKTAGEVRLLSCPKGYKLMNSTGHDNLECQKCKSIAVTHAKQTMESPTWEHLMYYC